MEALLVVARPTKASFSHAMAEAALALLELCGVGSVVRRMYGPMASSTSAQRESWLAEVRALVEHAA